MNKRIVGISIISIGFILIIGIIYVIFFHDFTGPELNTGQSTAEKETTKEPVGQGEREVLPGKIKEVKNYEIKGQEKVSGEDIDKDDLKRMASSFAERFGSYSNHSNFDNIIDLKIFMSSQMQTWADDYIEELRKKISYSDIYYGITTKSVLQEIKKYDSDVGQAEILVKTQRRESTGARENATVYYEDILIVFVKERESWKVASADWK